MNDGDGGRGLTPRKRIAACAALLALATASGAPAGPAAPHASSAAERPGLFDRLFDRREYLRQSEPLRRPADAAMREAEQARRAAAEARRAAQLPPLRPPPPGTVLERPEDVGQRRLRAAKGAGDSRQRLRQERLQRFLAGAARADTAAIAAGTAAARAARMGTIVRGMDRLQAGAAAARGTLGAESRIRPAPLIRSPRVDAD